MEHSGLRIFSYLPNPRVWKAQIAGELCGVDVEVVGDEVAKLAGWLWDFEARPLAEDERGADSPLARPGRRGFDVRLFKTDKFLEVHPFGTVPAAFSPDGEVGIFESNSILRAVARIGGANSGLYGRDPYQASRIDSFLDASLVFGREAQVYLLALREMTRELRERMAGAYEFYLDGIERALGNHEFIAGGGFIAGDELTLADISFACDLAQFLQEQRRRKALAALSLAPISDDCAETYPLAFAHMLALAERPEFAKYLGGYLERYRDGQASGS